MDLVIIPARGGSKGVPGKNIKLLNGQSLIEFTIYAARAVYNDEQIIVSTDSEEIKQVVEKSGLKVPYDRPPELATDQSSSYDVIIHALNDFERKNGEVEKIILLQPTSPFRTSQHITEASKLYNEELDMIVSVKETKANPYYVLREEDQDGYLVKSKESTVTRRQDLIKVWELNGAIYIINTKAIKSQQIGNFKKVKKYEMDELSSHDIDTPLDWSLAEVIAQQIAK